MTESKEGYSVNTTEANCVRKALGILRMIKLLGWTKRVEKDLEEKREQELHWVWRRLLYGFTSFNAK